MKDRNPEKIRQFYDDRYSHPDAVVGVLNLPIANAILDLLDHHISPLTKNSTTPRCLDIGCGKGALTEALRLRGFDAHGIDFSSVAIQDARQRWPACHFEEMDGLRPSFNEKFDLIICRGFSGLNTFDLESIASFASRHINLLTPSGLYIIGITSDFTGYGGGSWVNWRRDDLRRLTSLLPATQLAIVFDYRRPIISRLRYVYARLLRRKPKRYFYVIYRPLAHLS